MGSFQVSLIAHPHRLDAQTRLGADTGPHVRQLCQGELMAINLRLGCSFWSMQRDAAKNLAPIFLTHREIPRAVKRRDHQAQVGAV